jgi:hypothetical protein
MPIDLPDQTAATLKRQCAESGPGGSFSGAERLIALVSASAVRRDMRSFGNSWEICELKPLTWRYGQHDWLQHLHPTVRQE